MNKSENIHLFLHNGTLNGFIQCRIDNWNFMAFKIPRIELAEAKNWPDLKNNSIYFLFGKSSDKNEVYVGKASERMTGKSVQQRLQEHEHDDYKDFWTEAIVLVFNDPAWGLNELSYLEYKFYDIIKSKKDYELQNRNTPSSGNPHQVIKSVLEIFIERTKFIMGLLRYEIFEEPLFYITLKQGNKKAIGKPSGDDKFVVFAGSYINEDEVPSLLNGYKKLRIANKYLIDSNNKLTKDILFNSSSAAASFVKGSTANGNVEWKKANGVSLGDS